MGRPVGKEPIAQRHIADLATPAATGSGRGGLKRLKHRLAAGRPALNRPALRRLARRAGVKRLNEGIYDAAPVALRAWLSKIVQDSAVFTEHARRFTITLNDVLMALKRNGV